MVKQKDEGVLTSGIGSESKSAGLHKLSTPKCLTVKYVKKNSEHVCIAMQMEWGRSTVVQHIKIRILIDWIARYQVRVRNAAQEAHSMELNAHLPALFFHAI